MCNSVGEAVSHRCDRNVMTVALTQLASNVMSVCLQQFVYTALQTRQSEKLPRGRGQPCIKFTSCRLKKCPERSSFFVSFCKISRSSSGDGTAQNSLQHTSLLVAKSSLVLTLKSQRAPIILCAVGQLLLLIFLTASGSRSKTCP